MNKAMFSSEATEWETPQELFDDLDKEFNFDLDPCATHKNAKSWKYITKDQFVFGDIFSVPQVNGGLGADWANNATAVFMNPPYGREIGKWIKKAYEESQRVYKPPYQRRGCTVVCLLPARTDTQWYHDYCTKGEIRFLKGRLYFKDQAGKTGRAPFPSMIVVFRNKGENQ